MLGPDSCVDIRFNIVEVFSPIPYIGAVALSDIVGLPLS